MGPDKNTVVYINTCVKKGDYTYNNFFPEPVHTYKFAATIVRGCSNLSDTEAPKIPTFKAPEIPTLFLPRLLNFRQLIFLAFQSKLAILEG